MQALLAGDSSASAPACQCAAPYLFHVVDHLVADDEVFIHHLERVVCTGFFVAHMHDLRETAIANAADDVEVRQCQGSSAGMLACQHVHSLQRLCCSGGFAGFPRKF